MKFTKDSGHIKLLVLIIFITIPVIAILVLHPSLLKRSPVESVKQVLTTVSGTQAGLPTTEQIQKNDAVVLDVPFTVQAPFAEWSDPHQQEACEEASVLMVMHWVKDQSISGKQAAKDEILAISNYELDTFGSYHDTSAADTGKRILEGYYKYNNYEIKPVISADDVIAELEAGHAVIVPANGRALKNKYFTQPGPERHMFVIKGYDRVKNQFITNEPGISQGENWRYDKDLLFDSLRDYATGDKAPIIGDSKVMIVIKK